MSFHRRVKLAAFCAEWQIQLAIKGENLEVITVRARRRAWSAVSRFAEVVCPQYAFWRASLSDGARLRGEIPNGPVREQSTRCIRIIDNQCQAFRAGRNVRNLQGRVGICAVTCKFCWNVCTFLKSRTCDLHLDTSCGK